MKNKYHAKKITVDGETFDSQKEYQRWCQLRMLQKAGEIEGLQRQVTYTLIPEQREQSKDVFRRGVKAGQPKPGKVLEKPVTYKADFVYFEIGREVVEDVKGFKTKDYIIKRKLMLHIHNIRIKEI
jgi:hypothetical protein